MTKYIAIAQVAKAEWVEEFNERMGGYLCHREVVGEFTNQTFEVEAKNNRSAKTKCSYHEYGLGVVVVRSIELTNTETGEVFYKENGQWN